MAETIFVVDKKGTKTHAVIPIEYYEKLLELQQFLDAEILFGDKDKDHYYLKLRGIEAAGFPSSTKSHPRFVVLKGSQAKVYAAQSLSQTIVDLREQLIEKNILIIDQENDCLVFSRDYEFSSPSLAAGVIGGAVRNGLDCWVNAMGFSLKNSGYGPGNKNG